MTNHDNDLPDHVYARHLLAEAALRTETHRLAHAIRLDDLDDADELSDLDDLEGIDGLGGSDDPDPADDVAEFPERDGDSTCRLDAQIRADDAAIEVAEALRARAAAEKRASPAGEACIDLAESRGGARIDVRTGGRVPARLARTREVVARLAPKILVPLAAVTLLVIAMGGTWSTASATPTTAPWSAVRPPPASTPRAAPVELQHSAATSMVDDLAEPRTKVGRKDLIGKLNLNTASEDQLMMLPTVGPSKAERIVTWRKKNGGFKRTADLRRVKGFGYKTFKKLEPFLDTKGDTTLAPK